MINHEVMEKLETKSKHIFSIRKTQLKIMGHIMSKKGSECLIFTGHAYEKGDKKNKQRVTYSMKLSKWMVEEAFGDIKNKTQLIKT